jgi:hypothetical protein
MLRRRWLLESNPAEIDAAPDSLAAAAQEQQPQQEDQASAEQQAEEAAAVEFGPALPLPPDALQMLGQYDDSWQEQQPGERQEQQDESAEEEPQRDGVEARQEHHGEPPAAQRAAQPLAAVSAGDTAAAPGAAGHALELPPPAGVPTDKWAVMCTLVRFVQVRSTASILVQPGRFSGVLPRRALPPPDAPLPAAAAPAPPQPTRVQPSLQGSAARALAQEPVPCAGRRRQGRGAAALQAFTHCASCRPG